MSKTSIKLTLDKRRILKDGKYAVKLYIYHKKKTTYINIGNYYAQDLEWNSEEDCYRKGVENSTRLNNQISFIRNKAEQVVEALQSHDELKVMNSRLLKDEILNHIESSNAKYVYGVTSSTKKNRYTLAEYRDILVKLYSGNEQYSTADNYRYDINTFFDFLEDPLMLKDTPRGSNTLMVEITPHILTKYYNYLEKRGRHNYGIYNPLKRLKGLYNNAIKNGDFDLQYSPFNTFKLHKPKPKNQRVRQQRTKQNRHLYFEKLRELDLKHESELWHIRNYVLFMWNSMGMQYIDACLLRIEDINWDLKEFYYVRNKLKKYDRELIVPFTQESEQILKYYFSNKETRQKLIFPIFDQEIYKNGTKKQILTRYEWYRDKLNRGLKSMCELAKLPEKITSYEIRRIWGEHAKEEGVEGSIIKDSYGHTKYETTEGYTRTHTVDVIAETNSKLVSSEIDVFAKLSERKSTSNVKEYPMKDEKVETPSGPTLLKEKEISEPKKTTKANSKQKQSVAEKKTISLDTEIAVTKNGVKETKTVMDYLLSILQDVVVDGEIKISKAMIKFVSETSVKDGEVAKLMVDLFLEL